MPAMSLVRCASRLRRGRILRRAAWQWRRGPWRFLPWSLMRRGRRPAAWNVAVADRRGRMMRISVRLITLIAAAFIAAALIAARLTKRGEREQCEPETQYE